MVVFTYTSKRVFWLPIMMALWAIIQMRFSSKKSNGDSHLWNFEPFVIMQCKYNVAMLQKAMFMLENVNNTFAIKPCMGRNSPIFVGGLALFSKEGVNQFWRTLFNCPSNWTFLESKKDLYFQEYEFQYYLP